ncbi:MAG: Re/Si-specific NAD(P)(+) transhydrogenase subunit alpha [Lentisphaeria bacterium]|nr:Re/Si-specific NAD(P)(+) transhydrogenase subunit alpha [Candidatus Neomarinimicrobiota bacterium]MCF7841686.1 Re/Si-specific NAD(P)(+) transhydrogenase subunit alpha [Lentisphaeria bacterium]
MKIGIPKETVAGETRVALIPSMIAPLTKKGHEVLVESGAGMAASFPDEAYTAAGATIIGTTQSLYDAADIIFKVQPPQADKGEPALIGEGKTFIGYMAPFYNAEMVKTFQQRKITAFSMEFIPRITRAQSMDTLSSMATIAGYKAVLMAANELGKIFPLLMTAAGTITPANVLILGAGVAGLQAIATAKRLGARVSAFDPRPAVREQVESLGATFVEMELPEEDVETKGGYAKAQSDLFLQKEQEAIAARLPKIDAVITTAQIFGKAAPVLITEEMVKKMNPGSVIVDLAAENGGNCQLTEAGKTVVKENVTIIGAVNLPATVPVHASQMYAKNIVNLFNHLYQAEDNALDWEDEITVGACITRDGEITNEMVKDRLSNGGN